MTRDIDRVCVCHYIDKERRREGVETRNFVYNFTPTDKPTSLSNRGAATLHFSIHSVENFWVDTITLEEVRHNNIKSTFCILIT